MLADAKMKLDVAGLGAGTVGVAMADVSLVDVVEAAAGGGGRGVSLTAAGGVFMTSGTVNVVVSSWTAETVTVVGPPCPSCP